MDKPSWIREKVSLSSFMTLGIGGPADYFAEPKNDSEIQLTVSWCQQARIPYIVLGAGSNILAADRGYRGCSIYSAAHTISWTDNIMTVDAGAKLEEVIQNAVEHSHGGLDFLVGVPGTLGGAIVGNAGNRTFSIGQRINSVQVMDENGQINNVPANKCGFGYRQSRFQQTKDIILRASLELPKVDKASEQGHLNSAAKRKNIMQPPAGTAAARIFQNPQVRHIPSAKVRSLTDEQGVVSAEKLVQTVGLAGFQLGQIKISQSHPNFFINLGDGTADQVIQLMSLVKQKVRDTLGIQLYDEIRLIGFD